VESVLRERFPLAEIRFWRSQAKAEVDFVVNDGGVLFAYEVKAQRLGRPNVSRSLRSFIKTHRPRSVHVVNLSLDSDTSVEGVPVEFLSFPRFLEEVS